MSKEGGGKRGLRRFKGHVKFEQRVRTYFPMKNQMWARWGGPGYRKTEEVRAENRRGEGWVHLKSIGLPSAARAAVERYGDERQGLEARRWAEREMMREVAELHG